jgi:hypothetical protein
MGILWACGNNPQLMVIDQASVLNTVRNDDHLGILCAYGNQPLVLEIEQRS